MSGLKELNQHLNGSIGSTSGADLYPKKSRFGRFKFAFFAFLVVILVVGLVVSQLFFSSPAKKIFRIKFNCRIA